MTVKVAILGCGYVGTAVARSWRESSQSMTVENLPLSSSSGSRSVASGESTFEITVTTTTLAKVPMLQAVADRVLILRGQDELGLQSLLENQTVLLLTIGSQGNQTYEETYLQTAQTLAKVLKTNTTVQQVIYTSSYALYGNHQGAWVTEETPIMPKNPKEALLSQTEQVLLETGTRDRAICILRLAGIYGPDRPLERIFRPLAGTVQPGEGNEASNWIHLEDIVGAITFAQAQQLQGIYNLGNDEPLTRRVLLDRLCQHQGWNPAHWDASQLSQRAINVRLSNQKLKEAGYRFQHPTIVDL